MVIDDIKAKRLGEGGTQAFGIFFITQNLYECKYLLEKLKNVNN
jgi:hypothetical protein